MSNISVFLSYSALVNGQTFIMYAISTCKLSSSFVVSFVSFVNMLSEMSFEVPFGLMLSFMPEISLSLFLQ